MKKTIKSIITILCVTLIVTMLLGSCASAKVDSELEIKISVLSGTTGFGAAKMINDAKEGKTDLNYKFSVETDPTLVRDGLINGSIDIAALPTNVAALVYNKTKGAVKIAAVNTLGVLYLTSNGEDITDLSGIKGKTVYCPANNPAYIFEAICRAGGLEKDVDYTLKTISDPKEIPSLLIKGEAKIAVMPEPLVTAAKNKLSTLDISLDLTEEWEKLYGDGTILQGCIVVRDEWAKAHPKELEKFLEDYEASISFTNSDPKTASELIIAAGIAENAAVAEKAIPKCNIVYIDGEEMAKSLDVFFAKLYAVNPQAVGGSLPDSGIYLEK